MIADRTPIRRTWLDGGNPFLDEAVDHVEYLRFLRERLGLARQDGPSLPSGAPLVAPVRRPRPRDRATDALICCIWLGALSAAVIGLAAIGLIARLLWAALGGIS